MSNEASDLTTPLTRCEQCQRSLVPLNALLQCERPCTTCGKKTFVAEHDPKTGGMVVKEGDRPTMNLQLLANMFKLTGGLQFSRAGLDMFAKTRFLPQGNVFTDTRNQLPGVLDGWAAEAEAFLKASPRLAGLDLETEAGESAAFEIVSQNQAIPEFAAQILKYACARAKDALAADDAWMAAASCAMASGFHALLTFKSEMEEVVWRGHSVETLRTAYGVWLSNQTNDTEEFWQRTFKGYSFVLSQVFSAPVVVVAEKAYVGGKGVDNAGGGLADFLLKNEVTDRAVLLELKTPTTPLLSRAPYRNGVYAPSTELVGAVAQVSAYSTTLAADLLARLRSTTTYDPSRSECVVIIGNAERELVDEGRRRSFELYRSELRNVRIVTYDELFRRVNALLTLFGG